MPGAPTPFSQLIADLMARNEAARLAPPRASGGVGPGGISYFPGMGGPSRPMPMPMQPGVGGGAVERPQMPRKGPAFQMPRLPQTPKTPMMPRLDRGATRHSY
jgi:hypothetical protein